MRIDVNLSSRPFVNRTPYVLLVGSLAVLAAMLTAWNATSMLRSRMAVRGVQSQLHELKVEEEALASRRTTAEARLAKADLVPLTKRADAVNAVLAEKAVSWTLLLERLEELLPWSAALRQVGTSVGKDGVKLSLTIRAKTYDDALALLDVLEDSPCFSSAYPGRDQEPKTPQGDFEMTLEALHDPYCGDVPEVLRKKRGSRG